MRQERLLLGGVLIAISGALAYGAYFWETSQVTLLTKAAVSHPALPIAAQTDSPAGNVVREFYAAIGRGDWSKAMALETPEYRGNATAESFAAGYFTTRSISEELDEDGTNVVPVNLNAVDVYPDGVTRRREFHVVYTIADKDGRLLLSASTKGSLGLGT